jgi:gliding motility-associated lipoprotein GldH
MKKKQLVLIPFLFLMLPLQQSCDMDKTVFEAYRKFDNLSWNRFDILNFTMQLEEVDTPYDVFINIRHLPEAPYEEMTVNFTIFTASGDMRTTDYDLDFYDPDGQRRSECMGDFCDLLVPLRRSFLFSEPGEVRFEIENKYTKLEMPGIIEVGVIVMKAEKEE